MMNGTPSHRAMVGTGPPCLPLPGIPWTADVPNEPYRVRQTTPTEGRLLSKASVVCFSRNLEGI